MLHFQPGYDTMWRYGLCGVDFCGKMKGNDCLKGSILWCFWASFQCCVFVFGWQGKSAASTFGCAQGKTPRAYAIVLMMSFRRGSCPLS